MDGLTVDVRKVSHLRRIPLEFEMDPHSQPLCRRNWSINNESADKAR